MKGAQAKKYPKSFRSGFWGMFYFFVFGASKRMPLLPFFFAS